ncbi:MAG: hemerythrin domain-containing protein [Actinomycetota bacterium]
MDVIKLLVADHNRLRGLFARFRDAQKDADSTAMIEVAGRIFDELKVHTTLEEEIFYPAVYVTTYELAEQVDEAVQEHHLADTLMGELGQVEAASDEWQAKMAVLIEMVEHHAGEEETSMFPQTRSQLRSATLETMANRVEGRKLSLGVPVLEDMLDLTKEELVELAREQRIPGRSKMSREELAATVSPG